MSGDVDRLFGPYRRWYRFGLRSPIVLYGRSRFRPVLAFRTAYQRARYGIADSDAWSLDHFLAMVTVRGVQKLREWAHGHPPELTADEWDCVLAQIEDGFQAWVDGQRDTGSRERFDTAMRLYCKWFGALWD